MPLAAATGDRRREEGEVEKEASGARAVQLLRAGGAAALARLDALDLRGAEATELGILAGALPRCLALSRLDLGSGAALLREEHSALAEAVAGLPHLEILFAAGADLAEVPPVLAHCKQLKLVGFRDNRFEALDCRLLPEGLVWLIATGNPIRELPDVVRLQRVRKLMLSHCQLTSEALAPVAGLLGLEMLRAASNRLQAFPKSLLRHPRLAWVAVGGNPFTEKVLESLLDAAPAAAVDFAEVSLGERLGSGAGATVYAAEWRGRRVAVKLWTADRFSDGSALEEWAMNRVAAVPGHPALVGMLGAFQAPHLGMILELLESATPAGGPPSFASVTRDVLPPSGGGQGLFTAASALRTAKAVASALAYLHGRGLLHGDVYLHNTLLVQGSPAVQGAEPEARLGDLGAAAAVAGEEGRLLQRLEVRSFGWLLQDLLESLEAEADTAAATLALLRGLRLRCASEVPEELPSFVELAAALATPEGRAAL